MSTSPSIDLRFGGYIASVPTVAVLRNSVDPTQYIKGDSIIVLGNSDISDGRGGVYGWLPDSTSADDNFDVIAPIATSGHPGRWVLAVGPTPELSALVLAVGNEQAARIAGDSTVSASIHSEQTVRANADEALAERTTTLEASFNTQQTSLNGVITGLSTSNARITDEALTRATADQALASRTTTLEAQHTVQQNAIDGLSNNITSANGRIEDEETVRATADQALASRTATLEADYTVQQNVIGGLTTDLATAKATITDEASTRAAADSALASRTSTLEADFSTQQTTVGGLTTDLTAAKAAITDESSARADADSALATRTSTLEAAYTNQQAAITAANASISNESTVRSDADGALASQIATITAATTTATANLSARITDETTARTSADDALASRTQTLESTAGNLTSRVSVTESAIANLNGSGNAVWTVETVSGNNRAQISVHAAANNGAGVDIIGDVSIAGNLVVDGSLTTNKLGGNSVSNGDIVSVSSTFNGAGGVSVSGAGYFVSNWQTIASYNLNLPNPARVTISSAFKQSYNSSNGDFPAASVIDVDGSVVDEYWGAAIQDKIPMLGGIDLAAGNHVISIKWAGDGGITVYRPRLRVEWYYK